MAIVQISRITHRQGRRENLPQLSGGELGWAIDTRQLYIGNGTLEDGAPVIGNTEILTEFSNIFTSYGYTYRGFENETVTTGFPRELQSKLDDFVNVRDFGPQGKDDDTTDDHEGFQAAIDAAFRSGQPGRRALYVPAGTYYISEPLIIPAHAVIIGEGDTSSIIKYTSSALNNGAIFEINNNQGHVSITKLGFEGPDDFVVGTSTQTFAAIRTGIRDNSGFYVASENNHISITECRMSNVRYGVHFETGVTGALVDNCEFDNVDIGVYANPQSPNVSRAIKVSNSLFDSVYNEGIFFNTNVSLSISSNNIFLDVGNNISVTPVTNAIKFVESNNISNSDMFARSEADNESVKRIALGQNISIENGYRTRHGAYAREVGGIKQIDALILAGTDELFAVAGSKTTAFQVNYSFIQGTLYRTGTLTVVAVDSSTDCQWNDDYSTNDVVFGDSSELVLSADWNSTDISVRFAGPTTGTFNYSINYLG